MGVALLGCPGSTSIFLPVRTRVIELGGPSFPESGPEESVGFKLVAGRIKNPTNFFLAGDKTICYRELSCRCIKCRNHLWTECKNTDVGEWKRDPVDMVRVVASACVKTRNRRTMMSMARVKLAAAVTPGEVIAMESADDAEGFLWWLARAEGPAECYRGSKKTVDGLRLWTVDITYHCVIMKGFLQKSPEIFKLCAHLQRKCRWSYQQECM